MAVLGYQIEYNKLPPLGLFDEGLFVESRGDIIRILTGKDIFKNPREIAFYEPSSSNIKRMRDTSTPNAGTDIRDRQGHLYRLQFDWNGDRQIPNPSAPGTLINSRAIVYSAGPDGDYTTWKDNLTSWK